MRQFISRALQKLSKLTPEQVRGLFTSMKDEIERLEAVLHSMNEGVLVCDSNHNLILANKFAERILPLSSAEPGGGPVWNLIQDEKTSAFLEKTLSSGDKVTDREFNVEAKDVQRLLSISVSPLVKNYHVAGSLIHARDITEKRGREARMRRMESLASLTTLAAGVAHEIKNPLGSISIHMQLLQKTMKKNEDLYYQAHPEERGGADDVGPNLYFKLFHKYTGVIDEEIDRLNHIVVEFLFAVRPMNLDLREGDINSFIGDVMEFVRYELENARVETKLELEEKLPPVEFDERILKQALLNLIQNATAAMPQGGLLAVSTALQDDEIAIIVRDTGQGIPPENFSKIFEPYFTTRETGTGLGLTLVFKIIREHHGEIAVKSKEGEGSCFTLTLPVPQKERKLLTAGAGPAAVPE
ncbi:PAS domain-containing sensor histidine kinase [Spirochaetia bacterium]|nr:PAS domain-containing sensor histidine kinase [Spirochaetia bacterium]